MTTFDTCETLQEKKKERPIQEELREARIADTVG
jgi:hypothetical protein